ncbi:hypothetical protein SAMN05216194_11711 [Stutzerimonas kunmingensis]|jgi:hypothetical protein|uniref:hypothetical protein n=1 Tax=Stutzerimonas kunmingensis TaxID=1211807 RepID=UPI0008E64AA7|nr:hypothetical protein [Stutzerimonas kunmingensis]MCQ2045014.1 hypothetical protein [Stutzerimonas kunmingensis]SFK11208.1 hypothetical protein SAMN05216194_11711 [Stutzerimonas kunmingensis]
MVSQTNEAALETYIGDVLFLEINRIRIGQEKGVTEGSSQLTATINKDDQEYSLLTDRDVQSD